MKLWNNYLKEMKIASRGFYFYMEILMAAILLACILLFVPTEATNVSYEAVYAAVPAETVRTMLAGEGGYVQAEDTGVRLKPDTLVYYDEQTGEKYEKTYDDKKTLSVETWEYFDAGSGRHEKTLYVLDSFDDLLRMAKTEKVYSVVISLDNSGQLCYQLLLFGSESQRYVNLITAMMGTGDTPALLAAIDSRQVITLGAENALNNRQSYMPLAVVIMNGLMGMLVVIAYLTLDKSSGLIRAMALTPMHTRTYLFSKVLVVLTMSLLSSLVVTIPVMGAQPNYLLFILTAALVSVLSCMIGLWVASFFEDLKSAFGVIIMLMVLLLLPSMSYILPGFAPLWMKLLPTYPILQAVKETLLRTPDTGYVLLVCAGMAVLSAVFLWWSDIRYRKSLGV
ncbi:MAG TPA: ABC transporter permease [Candidatus Limiplasma sp.]|nr:ABC transporter permease [Candidatus Limiplasma sp.]